MPLEKLNVYDTPFLELRTPFTWREGLKFTLLCPLLLPRTLVGVFVLVIIALINSFAAYNCPVDKPLTPWRRNMVLFSKELLVVVFWMLGYKIKVNGRENIKLAEQLGCVAVFNHVAWLDAFVLVWLMAPSGVAKSNNADLPVIKHAVRALQTIYIPDSKLGREKLVNTELSSKAPPASKVAQVAASVTPVNAFIVSNSVTDVLLKRVNDPLYCKRGGYPMIVMAPEGTCGDGKCLLEFRTGAFVLGKPVLPILYHYKSTGVNPAWGIVSELWHYARIMCQWYNPLEVTILPPYVPSEAEQLDPKLYAQNVRALMAEKLGFPMVPQNYEHYIMLKRLKVTVSWDGRRVLAPPGVVDADGNIDVVAYQASLANRRR